uniref:DH domain-containing protein n=1 Tax=Nothoprocta perdicaria TaxID=30464 RepID=A0A8C6YQP3_NOTPE
MAAGGPRLLARESEACAPCAEGSSPSRAQVDIGGTGSTVGWARRPRGAAEYSHLRLSSSQEHRVTQPGLRRRPLPPSPPGGRLDPQNWQHTVSREVLANLPQKEIDRQEVINELFATEGSHLRILRVLDLLFYQRLKKEGLLAREELALLFPNLPDVIEIHSKPLPAFLGLFPGNPKLREEGPIIKEIGDLMLSRFDGAAKEEIQQVTADFCSYQSIALELIKTKQRKESRFQIFMQEAESNPQCRRLQLKDLIISEMQRLTKYPLLLENILKHTEGRAPRGARRGPFACSMVPGKSPSGL